MMLFKLVWASIVSRKGMASLTVFSIAISMLVLMSVAHLQSQLKQNFQRSVAGVDLIVGSRTSSLNLLLFSIFKIGYPSNNLEYDSFMTIANNPLVDWAVPISLGDSHNGHAVIGTTADYFTRLKYADKRSLSFAAGQHFQQTFEVVLGSAVAREHGYVLEQQIILSHGAGKVSFSQHKNHPFTVVGILQPTGTPMDHSVYIPLDSVEWLHNPVQANANQHDHEHQHTNQQLSAILIGAKSRIAVLSLQRDISQFRTEPLTAIIPGVALQELWQMMAVVETSLQIISLLVLLAALIGMATMLLASMRERRHELSVLRALGARPWLILLLVETEAVCLGLAGCVIGYLLLVSGLSALAPLLLAEYAFAIAVYPSMVMVGHYLLITLLLSALLAFMPAFSAYRQSLRAGLTIR